MPVTHRTLAILDDLRRSLDTVLDTQTRDLVRAWVDAWNEAEADLRTALLEMLVADTRVSVSQLRRSIRLQKALRFIATQLDTLAAQTGVRLTADLQAVIATAGAAQASVVDSQLPPGAMRLVDVAAWTRVDTLSVAAIVQRSTEQITALTRPLSGEAYGAVRRELIRGITVGSSPRAVADRIVRRAQRNFNGGLTRALVISRTEMLDAHREASRLGQEQHADVLAGWMWLSTLDDRTCPSCWAQHGRMHELDEPGPYDHQQGRCARMPVTKTWAELGFPDVVEPPSLVRDASQVFADLSPTEQRSILGPGRYAAWVAGEFPMDAWSVRRTSTGWRDSFGVAPVPRQSKGGRRSPKAA